MEERRRRAREEGRQEESGGGHVSDSRLRGPQGSGRRRAEHEAEGRNGAGFVSEGWFLTSVARLHVSLIQPLFCSISLGLDCELEGRECSRHHAHHYFDSWK